MKKITLVGLVLIILLAALSGCIQQPQEETVKIGAIFQETGSGAEYGEMVKKGLLLAVEKINTEGGVHGNAVEIIFEDSKSNAKDAVTALNKLIRIDGIKVVLSQQSSVVVALSPIVNENKIVLMDTGGTTPVYISANDFTFRVSYSAPYFAKAITSLLNEKEVKTIGVLYVNNDYGIGMLNSYRENFDGQVVSAEAFNQDDTDFRTQIQKIKEANPDTFVYTSHTAQAGIILKQAKELNLGKPIYTDIYSIEYQSILDTAGDAAEGVIYASQYYNTEKTDAVFKEFNDKFLERYGENSNPLSAQAFDGLMVLAFAMNQCGNPNDAECIKENLFKLENFQGVMGPITFDEFGEVKERPTVLKTVKNAQFVLYEGD